MNLLMLLVAVSVVAPDFQSESTLGCKRPNIINQSEEDWNSIDELVVKSSYRGCKRYFGPKSCPRSVTKTNYETYRVICFK